MEHERHETQPIDLRLPTSAEAERDDVTAFAPSRSTVRRLPAHVRLLIGVMALASLAVLGTLLAGALLAAGPGG